MSVNTAPGQGQRVFNTLIVVCYLALTLLYALVIPTGESPDEPSHLQCIEQVSLQHRLPVIDPPPQGAVWWARERIISGLVCAHMPLYYLVAGYTQKLVHLVSSTPIHYEFPPNNPLWEAGSVAMFTHPPKGALLTLHEPVSLAVLRIEAILFGLVSLMVAGRLARHLVPQRPHAARMAMILVAGWPQFLFMSRAINNDGLAVALAAGVLAVLVDVGKPKRYIVASGLAALAILTKFTMIFAAAAVVCAWGLEMALSGDKGMRGRLLRSGAVGVLVFGALAALLWFHPTLHAHLSWAQRTMRGVHSQALTITYWLDVFKLTLQSGWGRFGWMNLATPDLQVALWWAALLVTGGVGLFALWRRADTPGARLILWIACVWAVCVAASYLRIQVNRFQPQFRYALSILPVLAAFSGAGWATLTASSRLLTRALEAVLLGLLLLSNLWIILFLLAPAYG